MSNTIFIVWRESIEAMLVIGILYSWLKNQSIKNPQDKNNGMLFLWGGVIAGFILAVALAIVMLKAQSQLASEALQYFQIGMMLLATLLITQMVLWMRRNGRSLKKDLEWGLANAVNRANWWRVFILSAIAVGREGAETVIFLYGAGLAQKGETLPFILSAFAGFTLAFICYWILSKGTRYFSWQLFFRFSEAILLLLAAALLTSAVDQMIGLEWIPTLVDPIWDSNFLLDDSSQFGSLISSFTGYRALPALSLLLIYIGYWILVSWLMSRIDKITTQKVKQ